MASFFGEVKPLSSRAVDDEEAESTPKYSVVLEKSQEFDKLNSPVKLMIVAVGETASVFVNSYMLSDTAAMLSVIKYMCEENDVDSYYRDISNSKRRKVYTAASVILNSSNVLLCKIPGVLPEDICFEVSNILTTTFKCNQALILSSSYMSTYKREESGTYEMPFLKSLYTSCFSNKYSTEIPCLESPNFLSNIQASLLINFELSHLPALCVTSYVDSDVVDSINVEAFENVLKESILSDLSINGNAKFQVLRLVKAKQLVESNLYV